MKNQKLQKSKNQLDSYLKYSSLALQMGGTIAFFVWLGMQVDDWQSTKEPYFTVASSLLGVFLSLYFVIKGLLNKK